MPEPTLIEQPRVTAEAMLGKEPAAGAATTQEQEMAKKAREELAKDISAHQVMEGMTPHPAPTEATWRFINNEKIGTERKGGDDPTGGEKEYVKDSRSEEFRKRTDANAELAQQLLSKKYEEIEDKAGAFEINGKKVSTKEYLVKQCMDAVMSWPAGKAVFEAYGTGTAADAFRREKIEELFLNNPQFLKRLGARFGEIYSGDKTAITDLVSEAQDEFKRVDGEFDRKKNEVKALTDRIEVIEARQKQFVPAAGSEYANYSVLLSETTTEKVAWYEGQVEELAALRNQERNLKGMLIKNIIDTKTKEITGTTEDQAAKARLEQVLADIKEMSPNVSKMKVMIEKRREIDEELKSLDEERKGLKEKEPGMQNELADLDIKRSQAERVRQSKRAEQIVNEEQFTNEVEGMFKDAGMRFMQAETIRYEAVQKKLADKATADAQDRDEKQLQKCMGTDWRKAKMVGVIRTSSVDVVNNDEVRVVYEKAIHERSMEWYVINSMETHLREIEGTLGNASLEWKEERARLDERFNNKEFMKSMSSLAMERLFRNYLEGGGKPKKEDVFILTETEGGIATLNRALDANKEASEEIGRLQKRAAFSGSKAEFIRALAKNPDTYKKAGIGIAGLLALLFGAPFLAVGVGLAAEAYGAVGSAVNAPFIS